MSSFIMDPYSKQFLDQNGYPNLHPANLWALEITGFPYGDLLIQETTLPLYKLSVVKTLAEISVPEQRDNFSEFSMSFYDTPDFKGYNFCREWLDNIYDYNKMVWRKGFQLQKFDATLKFISLVYTNNINGVIQDLSENNTNFNLLKKFVLKNMFITGISDLSLANDNGDPITFEITAQIDNVES